MSEGCHDRLALLTPRLRQVAQMLMLGFSADTIASDLGITRNTVLNHLKEIGKRLGVSGKRAEITAYLVYGVRQA